MRDSVLLTGASGFLGNILQQELSSTIDFTTLGRSPHNRVVVDLANAIPEMPKSVDWVIHAAGHAHVVPRSPAESQKFFEINVKGTQHLLKALEVIDPMPKSLVYISSVAVYGRETGMEITETEPLAGTSPYAKSKIETEKWVMNWCLEHGIVSSILRLPLIAGRNAPGNLGSMISAIKRNRYFGIGKGDARKSVVLASDVAQFIPRVQKMGGIYNLTDGHSPTMIELENGLALALNKRTPIRLPFSLMRGISILGSRIPNFPLTREILEKLTTPLTFDDQKARSKAGWQSNRVIDNLVNLV